MVDIRSEGKELVHYWSKCVSAGRANEGLRASWQEQLKMLKKDCGFSYLRFHGLLHDDMNVYRVVNGKEIYNFQYIDDLFDALLDMGIRPVVELGFMPGDMASDLHSHRQFWWQGNVNPPADFERWGRLIEKLARHFVERYGLDEVKEWYFEVWNEANLYLGFWNSTKSDYLRLYKYAALAVKSVDASLRVGGPATSNYVPDDRFAGEYDDESRHRTHQLADLDEAEWRPVWIEDFMNYCMAEGLPVDFISAHPYPTDFALDGHGKKSGRSRGVDSTRKDLLTMRSIVDASPFPDAEILFTEWSSSPSSRDNSHDYPPAAAFVVKCNIESRGLADALAYWTFSDIFEELGAGAAPFHGGFGMINYQGIKKPVYHAYRFLHELGDREIAAGSNYLVTKKSVDGKMALVAYNYASDTMKTAVTMTGSFRRAEEVMAEGRPDDLSITIEGFRPGAKFKLESVSYENGCAMGLYKKLGYPADISRETTALLKMAADAVGMDVLSADEKGKLQICRRMEPWEILLIKEL